MLRSKLFISLMVLALAGTLIGGATFAWFTDSATSANNSFKAGTLSLDNDALAADFAFEIPNMAPGDVTEEYSVTIKNDGTLPLGWFGKFVMGESILKNVIYIKDMQMEFLNPETGNWEPTDKFITGGVGSGDYGSFYSALADADPLDVISLASWAGNASMFPGSGYEFMGALDPEYSYKLSFTLAFHESAGNAYQGAGPLTLGFQVDAAQVNSAALEALITNGSNHYDWMVTQLNNQP